MNNFHKFQNFRQFSNSFSQIWLKKRHTSLFSGICREIRTKFHQKFAEKMQNSTQKMKKSEIHSFIREKNVDDFWLKFWDWRTVQRSALCRSRRELSNDYLLDEIGVDTAENELLQVLFNIIQYYSIVSLVVNIHCSIRNCFADALIWFDARHRTTLDWLIQPRADPSKLLRWEAGKKSLCFR